MEEMEEMNGEENFRPPFPNFRDDNNQDQQLDEDFQAQPLGREFGRSRGERDDRRRRRSRDRSKLVYRSKSYVRQFCF